MDDVPSTLSQARIAQSLVKAAIAKHNDRYENVFLKAVAAGAMLSFGGLLSEVLSAGASGLTQSNPGIVKVLGGFVFPVGLVMIVLQGFELLTSNMMTFPMAVIKKEIPWWSLPLNWVIVLFGNLVGSLFTAAILVHYSAIVSTEPYISYIQTFALHKAADPHWHQIFLRGIGCNWLVSVAIWQATGARETISKIFAIWIPIWIFVACGFDHVVANMFSVPLGIMFGADLTVAAYIRKSLIAAFLGNVVGALIVALPATYFYLLDCDADGLRAAENGTPTTENFTIDTQAVTTVGDSYMKRELVMKWCRLFSEMPYMSYIDP
ncbi:putative formate transporter [Termitomyces sp. T112]|nr:putative formate transporter [Termitomyces sp. T112]